MEDKCLQHTKLGFAASKKWQSCHPDTTRNRGVSDVQKGFERKYIETDTFSQQRFVHVRIVGKRKTQYLIINISRPHVWGIEMGTPVSDATGYASRMGTPVPNASIGRRKWSKVNYVRSLFPTPHA